MRLFQQQKQSLKPVKEVKIQLEKDLQAVTEQNLDKIFGLEFISSEFQLNSLRIDSLAFDLETKAFVIIEYKRDRSFSIIDQGYAYLSLMLNNKADFILEYNERMDKNLKRGDVDWTQTRVLFIAHSFTNHQREAINFKDLPIELWEVQKYEGGLISFNPIKALKTAESIKTVSRDEAINKVAKQVKSYTINDHFKPDWKVSRDLYEQLRDKLFSLEGRFEETPRRGWISYKIGTTSVVSVKARKTKLVFELTRTQPKDLKDPAKKVSYIDRSMEHWNQHMSYADIAEADDVDYAIFLTKQLLERFAKDGVIE